MDPRRTLIADAALQVIADKGIRGLTHLAVDTQAELPKGSTSYYCRKRVDLLRLTLRRLFTLDQIEMGVMGEQLTAAAPCSDDVVIDVIAAMVERWLSPPARSRTIARFELFLAVAHDPELRDLNGDHMSAVVKLSLAAAAATDPPKSPLQVAAMLMMLDGLMMTVIRQNLPAPELSDVARLARSILSGPSEVEAPGVPPVLESGTGTGDLSVQS